jgi:hypothetical protein
MFALLLESHLLLMLRDARPFTSRELELETKMPKNLEFLSS